jgi:hypothetical protein
MCHDPDCLYKTRTLTTAVVASRNRQGCSAAATNPASEVAQEVEGLPQALPATHQTL